MFLVGLCDEAVLPENLEVVSFGNSNKIIEFSLNLVVPILIIVQKLWIQIIAEQGATGRPDIASLTDLNGEDVAALFVTVQGFHGSGFSLNGSFMFE